MKVLCHSVQTQVVDVDQTQTHTNESMLSGWAVRTLRVFLLARLTLPDHRGGMGVGLGVRLEDAARVRACLDDPGSMYVRVRVRAVT